MQLASGRLMDGRADPAAASSYALLFATYAVALGSALAIYLFSRDAPPTTARASAGRTADAVPMP